MTAASILSPEIMDRVSWAARKAPSYLYEDAVQEAIVGALGAMARFDPARAVQVQTFVGPRASGAVLDFYRRWFPRRQREGAEDFGPAVLCELRYARDRKYEGPTPEQACIAGNLRKLLHAAIPQLGPEEARIVRMLLEDQCCEDIARDLRCSVKRVYYVRSQAVGRLRRMLCRNGENAVCRSTSADAGRNTAKRRTPRAASGNFAVCGSN